MRFISYCSSGDIEVIDAECKLGVNSQHLCIQTLGALGCLQSWKSTRVVACKDAGHGLVQVMTRSGSVYTLLGSREERQRLLSLL